MANEKMSGFARIVTLGCRLNAADSALLYTALEECGYTPSETETPGLLIVNTCAVTAEAERKTCQTLRRLRREYPAARIVAVGCAAAADEQGMLRAGADLVCGNAGKRALAAVLRGETPPEPPCPDRVFQERRLSSFPFRSRAFIKIQEGCDNFCSYCIVPLLRGAARSRDFAEVLADCRKALDAGFPELVLTGVNTCAYADGEKRLPELLEAIAALPGDFRIRIGSTEPATKYRGLVDAVAEQPKMCRFLHLSLQHGSDAVLKRMNRHYSAAEYADFVLDAKRRIDGLHLGTDVIVGFPGESDGEFAESCRFIERIAFANIHVFAYSPRPGTPAAEMPDRPSPEVVKRRCGELRKIAEASARKFAESQIDRELPVIFERIEDGVARGWSDNYLEVAVPADGVVLGKIVSVKATAGNIAPPHQERGDRI
jgi:threonylcarbamoyladenosine tRNA methylthiotransferase MtaB